MSTTHHPAAADDGTVRLEHLPPLTVVTEGIPRSEHLDAVEAPVGAAPRAAAATSGREPVGRGYRLGVAALLALVLGSFGYGVGTLLEPVPTGARMGLSAPEWTSYRSGERQPATTPTAAEFAPFASSTPFTAAGR